MPWLGNEEPPPSSVPAGFSGTGQGQGGHPGLGGPGATWPSGLSLQPDWENSSQQSKERFITPVRIWEWRLAAQHGIQAQGKNSKPLGIRRLNKRVVPTSCPALRGWDLLWLPAWKRARKQGLSPWLPWGSPCEPGSLQALSLQPTSL